MLINELSKLTGITAHTIRFYEKSGLIKGKKDDKVKTNNYYHYDEEVIARLSAIREAKSVGFTINEIAEIIDSFFNDIYTTQQKLLILDKKLGELAQKSEELKRMKKKLLKFRQEVMKET